MMPTLFLCYVLAIKVKDDLEADVMMYLWFPEDPICLPTVGIVGNIREARFIDSEDKAIQFRKRFVLSDPEHYKNNIHILPVSCELKVVKFPKELEAFAG